MLISYTLTAWNSQYLVTIKKNVSKSSRAVSVNLTEVDNILSGKLSPVYTVRIPHLGTWQASEGEGEIKKKTIPISNVLESLTFRVLRARTFLFSSRSFKATKNSLNWNGSPWHNHKIQYSLYDLICGKEHKPGLIPNDSTYSVWNEFPIKTK